jgi:hypothetical protein
VPESFSVRVSSAVGLRDVLAEAIDDVRSKIPTKRLPAIPARQHAVAVDKNYVNTRCIYITR